MVLEIDGSVLEGGGQILRVSIALSVIRQTPIRIFKIRANRSKPGLAPQHLTGVRLARELSQGRLENDELGSTEVTFTPSAICSGKFVADTQTGGSVALLLQAALPCILFGKGSSELTLKGGTNADLAPQIDYVVNVLKPTLEKFEANFNLDIIKRGFFVGNGVVKVKADPVVKLLPVNLVDFGVLESIQGEAFVAGVLPLKMANEMAEAAEKTLRKSIKMNISIKSVKFNSSEAFGNGSGINLVAKTTTGCFLGSSDLGRKGVSTQEVGSKAAELLLESIKRKVCVDQKMQDQIILFMALADGKSRVKTGPITSHTKTAIYVTELFTKAKFDIISLEDDINIIECDGVGHMNVPHIILQSGGNYFLILIILFNLLSSLKVAKFYTVPGFYSNPSESTASPLLNCSQNDKTHRIRK